MNSGSADSSLTRDDAAVALAEKWWPERYIGDLTTAEWQRVYAALDAAPSREELFRDG